MQTDILIVGGGLTGLMAAWQLDRAGAEVLLLEARNRFGGRVWTVGQESGANCDMGPSWFWPGQPLIVNLLRHFQIPYYDQFEKGTTLFQQPDGSMVPALPSSPMAGAHRIDGGIGRLADAIAGEMTPARRKLEHKITKLALSGEKITAEVHGPEGEMAVEAKYVALALPPRIAADLAFDPALPSAVTQTLASTPTWMAGHAKFFAIYDSPFWRGQGLCGSAISRRGPLAEIHDASPDSGNVGALFGFAGLDAQSRDSMGQDAFIQQATTQLGAIFGEQALRPSEVYFQDWSVDPYTANAADQQPQTRHPQYGLSLDFGTEWGNKLDHISSETSYQNGGLIEGALETGLAYAKRIVDLNFPSATEKPIPTKPAWIPICPHS